MPNKEKVYYLLSAFAAFGLLSTGRRSKYNFTNWENGLKANYRNNVKITDVQKINATSAVFFILTNLLRRKGKWTNIGTGVGRKMNLIFEGRHKKLDSYTE